MQRRKTNEEKIRHLAGHPGQFLKKMRLSKGISPNKAARMVEISLSSLKRFERREQEWPKERVATLVRRYGFSQSEYREILSGARVLPEINSRSVCRLKSNEKSEPRKYRKEVSKECRVLKVMREMANLTQPQAADRCGWHRSSIDHRENGRVILTREDIGHMVKAYGFTLADFDEMVAQPILRDEAIKECLNLLSVMDGSSLIAVQALVQKLA